MSEYRYEYAFPVPLPGDRETVYRALTDGQALRCWFAEHVEVEARPGGLYRFWGKHTLDGAEAGHANQRITRMNSGRELAFSWRLLGAETEVTWLLDDGEEPGTSMVTVRHLFDALPSTGRAEAMIDDLWRIHTGQLCMYLHGNEICRPDFSGDEAEVRCEITIEASPESVFAALITPEYISQWFPAPAPVVEPFVGGRYGFGFSYVQDGQTIEPPPMTILEFEQDRKLAVTWADWRGDPSVPDQKVTWLLEDLGGRTRLTLVHEGFARPVDVSDYPFGWQEFLHKIGNVSKTVEVAATV